MTAPALDERIGLWFSTLSGHHVTSPDDPRSRAVYVLESVADERLAEAERALEAAETIAVTRTADRDRLRVALQNAATALYVAECSAAPERRADLHEAYLAALDALAGGEQS